ncbi:MAG: peptidoglycan-binding protein [Alphaproteobacteria bacterium]|nr:MAG: peptidoglycan-binding protein [Alphaproteobacteria bacterium]
MIVRIQRRIAWARSRSCGRARSRRTAIRPGVIVWLGLAFAVFVPGAQGADAQGRFAIKGAGLASCRDYTQARADQSQLVYSLLGWLDGYLTAYNQLSADTFDVAAWESTDLFAQILDGHCKTYSDHRFVTVVRAIVAEIADQRLTQNSPLIAARNGGQGLLIYQETLRRVQEKLSQRGLYSGAIDGRFDDPTRAALERFQAGQGLAVSGLPDQPTLWKLFRPPPTQ